MNIRWIDILFNNIVNLYKDFINTRGNVFTVYFNIKFVRHVPFNFRDNNYRPYNTLNLFSYPLFDKGSEIGK